MRKKASRSQNADSLQAAVDYALNKDKTEQDLFCSAIGCTLDSAFEDMCQIKKMWHKEKGVQGFHLVQSFAAGGGNAGIGPSRLAGNLRTVCWAADFKWSSAPI